MATGAALATAFAPNEDVVGLKQRGQQAIGGAVIPLAGAGIGKVLGTVKGYINPEAVSALTKAIKPGKWNKNFPSDAAIALPIIKQSGQTVNNIDDFVGATAVAKTNTWNKIDKLLKQATGDTKVSHNYEDILARAKQLKEEAIGEYSGTAEFIDNFRNITSGIKPYSKAINGKRFLAEELKSVPSKFKNVNGLYLDEAVTSYNNAFGTKYNTNEFTQLLKDHGSVKLPSSNIKDYVGQANRDLSEYFGDSLIDGDMIAKKLRGTVKPESIKLSPEIGDAVNTVANKYEKIPVSIMEAEDRLQQLNSELTGFFKSSPRSGYIKEQQSEVAALLAERKILRSELYDKIQSLTGTDIAPLKKQYGALMNIQDEALGRMNVASRQAPVSLQQAINGLFGLAKAASGDMSGLLQIGGSAAIKKWNSTDFLIRKAMQNTGKLSLGNRISNAVPAFYKNAASSDFNKPLPPSLPLKKALGNQTGGIGKGEPIKVYRGGKPIDLTKGNKVGISVSTDKSVADRFAGYNKGGVSEELILSPNAKILDANKLTASMIKDNLNEESIINYARKNNYDVIDFTKSLVSDPKLKGTYLPESEIRVLNPKILSPSSPLAAEGIGKVGENRNPLIEEAKKYKSAEEFVSSKSPVYHGTNTGGFDEFSKDFMGMRTGAPSAKKGIFFSTNKNTAEGYAEIIKDPWKDELANIFKGKPLLSDNPFENLPQKSQVYERYLDIKNPMIYDYKGSDFREESFNNLIDKAKKNGHDGVIFKNVNDNMGRGINKTKDDIHVVFEPSQIKTKSQLTDIWNKATGKGIKRLGK